MIENKVLIFSQLNMGNWSNYPWWAHCSCCIRLIIQPLQHELAWKECECHHMNVKFLEKIIFAIFITSFWEKIVKWFLCANHILDCIAPQNTAKDNLSIWISERSHVTIELKVRQSEFYPCGKADWNTDKMTIQKFTWKKCFLEECDCW